MTRIFDGTSVAHTADQKEGTREPTDTDSSATDTGESHIATTSVCPRLLWAASRGGGGTRSGYI